MKNVAFKPVEKITTNNNSNKETQSKYNKTFLDYIRDVGQEIFLESDTSVTVESTLYTVPAGYIFYIDYCLLSCSWNNDTGGERALIAINDGTREKIIMAILPPDGIANVGSQTICHQFINPFIIRENQLIRIDNPSNGETTTLVHGYLVQKSLSF